MSVLQYFDRESGEYVTVSPENPMPIVRVLSSDGDIKSKVAHLEPIADPSEATTEDVARAYNDLLAALKG